MTLLRLPNGDLFEAVTNEGEEIAPNRVWRFYFGNKEVVDTSVQPSELCLNVANIFETEIFPRLQSFVKLINEFRSNEEMRLKWHLGDDQDKLETLVTAIPHFRDSKYSNLLQSREEKEFLARNYGLAYVSETASRPRHKRSEFSNSAYVIHEDRDLQIAIEQSLSAKYVTDCRGEGEAAEDEENEVEDDGQVVFLGKRKKLSVAEASSDTDNKKASIESTECLS